MTDSNDGTPLDLSPLGRSAEEVEAESSNRINPPSLDGSGAPTAGPSLIPPVPVNQTGATPTGNVDALGTPRGEIDFGAALRPDRTTDDDREH